MRDKPEPSDVEKRIRRGNAIFETLPDDLQAVVVVLGMRVVAQGLSRAAVQMGLMEAETTDLDDLVKVIARAKADRALLVDARARLARVRAVLATPCADRTPQKHAEWRYREVASACGLQEEPGC